MIKLRSLQLTTARYTWHGHKLRFPVARFAGLKPPAQCMEALRAGRWRDESDLFDFLELRQDFSPPNPDWTKAQFVPAFSIATISR